MKKRVIAWKTSASQGWWEPSVNLVMKRTFEMHIQMSVPFR